MTSDPEGSRVQTEAQRLNAGVYRWVVRTLVAVLLMFALVIALLTISPDAADVVVLIGVLVSLSMVAIALSYNLRKMRLMRRIGKKAYLEQERGPEPQRPVSRRRRMVYLGAFGAVLLLELIVQILRLAALRH